MIFFRVDADIFPGPRPYCYKQELKIYLARLYAILFNRTNPRIHYLEDLIYKD